MRSNRTPSDPGGVAELSSAETELLDPAQERLLLQGMAECRAKLAEALGRIRGSDVPKGSDEPQALAQFITATYSADGPGEARLGAVFRRYTELRGRLAMANLRLVAHMAKQFRDRGIPHSDLMQEGFCGLLEAIDRFDLSHETKLATYATWWIRQAMQRAVASGAYPVRLSPRHLRQLAKNQDEIGRPGPDPARAAEEGHAGASSEMIHRIHAATRPAVSLDAALDVDTSFSLLQAMAEPEHDRIGAIDTDETLDKLLEVLRPREREVLSLRFGLGGQARLSLSQVGSVLNVSKERIRQIQDRALEKLRASAYEHRLDDLFLTASQ